MLLFFWEIRKIIFELSAISPLIWSSVLEYLGRLVTLIFVIKFLVVQLFILNLCHLQIKCLKAISSLHCMSLIPIILDWFDEAWRILTPCHTSFPMYSHDIEIQWTLYSPTMISQSMSYIKKNTDWIQSLLLFTFRLQFSQTTDISK